MESEWSESSLGELIDIKHGFAFQGKFIYEEPRGDILLTPGNFAIGGGFKGDKFKYFDGPVPDDFVLAQGDLLVTMTDLSKQSDTLGLPAFVPARSDGRRYLHNQRLGKIIVRDEREIDARFLHYLMCSASYRHEVLASATGTTVKHTSPDRIRRYKFMRPPLPEQRAIAQVLGALDDKIKLNRRVSETLEAMVRALFKSWFVDFDPVRAKAEGRDFGLPQPLADLFPAHLVHSELRDTPEGWEVGVFGDVVERVCDNENPLESPDTVFRHYSIPAFDDGQWPKRELGESIKSVKTRVPPGVVLLSKLNPEIERVWLADVEPDTRAICSTEFLVLDPRAPYGRAFVYCLARSPLFQQQLRGLVTGTSKSHQRAHVDSVLSLPVARPTASVLSGFEGAAEPLLTRSLECRRESRTLAALRDALLPELISGKSRVGDIEQTLEAMR